MSVGPGSRLDGYELLRALGRGGMGEVWLATELHLGRKVALKLLPAELTRDRGRVARFEREARAASGLNHPNVCVIHALGTAADGLHYIAMEFVEGVTLRARLASGRLTASETLDVAVQIASALTAAHESGIVHRDIKPENVMIRRDGLVKVLDFGLAKLTSQSDANDSNLTETAFNTEAGAVVGTVQYMSPEQARGEPTDPRTDIWALGALVYEMVSGQSPFAARSSSDVIAGILQSTPAPLARFDPAAPAELQRIVTKALRKDRQQRYQTARDLLLDLQALRDDLRSPVASDEGSGRGAAAGVADRRTTSRRTIRAVWILAVLGTLTMGALWWRMYRSGPVTSGSSGSPIQRKLTRLTFDQGLQSNPTWSPDGQSIAYASNVSGNFDIWVQTVRGGEARQVTRSPAADTQPSWSPTSDDIVFRSDRDGGGLFVVPATGGAERQLTSFGEYPRWTPDGSEILFGSSTSGSTLYSVPSGAGQPPTEIQNPFLSQGLWSWIASHPDGRLSALGLHSRGEQGFYTISRDGMQVTRSAVPDGFPLPLGSSLLSGQGTRVERFQWNSKGTALYVDAYVNEVRNIWRVDVDPQTLAWRSAEQLTRGAGADTGASLSPDGTRLLYTTELQTARLWVFALDSAGRRLIGEGVPLTPEDASVRWSDLSPDGRMVGYVMRRSGSNRVDLWTVDIEGRRRERLAQNVLVASWSHDGTSIAYSLFRDEPAPGHWALAARALTGPERLLSPWDHASAVLPSDWSKDGTRILGSYFSPVSAPPRLVLWPSSRPSAKPDRILMAERDLNFWQGRFSPNGRWISFIIGRVRNSGGVELMVAPADGAPATRWIRVAANHIWPDKPRWSSDGRTLYFLSRNRIGRFDLWGVAFDPDRGRPIGEPFAITAFDSARHTISSDVGGTELGIAAGRALFTMERTTGNLWLLENVDK